MYLFMMVAKITRIETELMRSLHYIVELTHIWLLIIITINLVCPGCIHIDLILHFKTIKVGLAVCCHNLLGLINQRRKLIPSLVSRWLLQFLLLVTILSFLFKILNATLYQLLYSFLTVFSYYRLLQIRIKLRLALLCLLKLS